MIAPAVLFGGLLSPIERLSIAVAADPPAILRFGDATLQPIRDQKRDQEADSDRSAGTSHHPTAAPLSKGQATLQIVGSGNHVRFVQPVEPKPEVAPPAQNTIVQNRAVRPVPTTVTMPTSLAKEPQSNSRFAHFYDTKQVANQAAAAPPADAHFAHEMDRGSRLEKSGNANKARSIYERLTAQFPDRYEPYHRLGLLADRARRHEKAAAFYIQALQRNPNDAGILNNLGYCHLMRGNLAAAERILNRAIRADGSNARYHNNLGVVYGKQAKYREALDCFRRGGSRADAMKNLEFVLASSGMSAADRYQTKQSLIENSSPELNTSELASYQTEPTNRPMATEKEAPQVVLPDRDDSRESIPAFQRDKARDQNSALARKAASLRSKAHRMMNSRISRSLD